MSELARLFDQLTSLLERLEQTLPAPAPVVDWAQTRAFRWRHKGERGALEAVPEISDIRLKDLLCIDRAKQQIDANTRQFLAGVPANNVLLWGPKGTGKSSLIKGLLNEYADRGLKLIEVERQHLQDLPDIAALLRGRPERCIVYCDDLSFEAGDPSYKTLKVILDGSIANTPDNVLVYATSNRRHLLPEFHDENNETRNLGGEIHHGEGIEEKLSLSERFGLWIALHPFTQDEYLNIVKHWLRRFEIDAAEESYRGAALQWALLHGSRSGRSAWQFARDWAGKTLLKEGISVIP
jgi:hypothetical protein